MSCGPLTGRLARGGRRFWPVSRPRPPLHHTASVYDALARRAGPDPGRDAMPRMRRIPPG